MKKLHLPLCLAVCGIIFFAGSLYAVQSSLSEEPLSTGLSCECGDSGTVEEVPLFPPDTKIQGIPDICFGLPPQPNYPLYYNLERCYTPHPDKFCSAFCTYKGYTSDSDPEPDPEPEPDPTPAGVACTNVPSLENFTTTQNTCSANEISMAFAPKGAQQFYLHVNLKFENGRDVLSTWCTGDEKLCKAVGNGQACSGTDYTGANAWCYKAN